MSFNLKRRFLTLDALRGIAALMVMLFHFQLHSATHLFPSAFMAVDFFFILSGFVLAHSYGERLHKGMTLGDFMRQRLIRLYPLYFIGTFLGAVYLYAILDSPFARHFSFADFIKASLLSLCFLPYFNHGEIFLGNGGGPGAIFPLNDPAWSLFFELVANLLFASWIMTTRRTIMMVIVSAVVFLFTEVYFGPNAGWSTDNFWGGIPRVGLTFFIGVALYQAYAKGVFPPLHVHPFFVFALVIGIMAVPLYEGEEKLYHILSTLYVDLSILCIWPSILIVAVMSDEPHPHWDKLFSWLGLISYGIYVLHVSVYRLSQLILSTPKNPLHTDASLAFNLGIGVICVGAASALTYGIDLPVRRLWMGRFKKQSLES